MGNVSLALLQRTLIRTVKKKNTADVYYICLLEMKNNHFA